MNEALKPSETSVALGIEVVRYGNTYAPKPIMVLQIGCFEYSMELEKAIGIRCTFQQNQAKLNEYAYYVKRVKVLTEVTSKQDNGNVLYVNDSPKRIASRHMGSLMPLAYNVFFQDKVHPQSLSSCRAPTTKGARFASLIIYNYRSLTSSVQERSHYVRPEAMVSQ